MSIVKHFFSYGFHRSSTKRRATGSNPGSAKKCLIFFVILVSGFIWLSSFSVPYVNNSCPFQCCFNEFRIPKRQTVAVRAQGRTLISLPSVKEDMFMHTQPVTFPN